VAGFRPRQPGKSSGGGEVTNGRCKSLKHHNEIQALFVAWYNFARENEALNGALKGAKPSDGQWVERPRMDDQRTTGAGCGSSTKMTDSTYPEFEGKTLLVCLNGRQSEDAYVVDNPKVETLLGRFFITGNITPLGGPLNFSRSLPIAIAWDQVQNWIVWESSEHYYERRREFYEHYRPSGLIAKLLGRSRNLST
jgi:hypothetical protein